MSAANDLSTAAGAFRPSEPIVWEGPLGRAHDGCLVWVDIESPSPPFMISVWREGGGQWFGLCDTIREREPLIATLLAKVRAS